MQKRSIAVLAMASASVLLGLPLASVGAATSGATITSYPTSLPAAGGLVTESYHAPSNAIPGVATCTLTATGPNGFSESLKPCVLNSSKLITQTYTWDVPADTGASKVTYTVKFAVSTGKTGGTTSSASTRITETPAAATTYVALGDSYSSGEGNPASGWVDYNGKADKTPTATDGCDRSSEAYPDLVNSWLAKQSKLPKMSFTFLACSGATTTDLWSSSPAHSDGLTGATTNHQEEAQLDDSRDLAHARIITLSAGGDDVNFSSVAAACVLSHYAATSTTDLDDALTLLNINPLVATVAQIASILAPTFCSSSSLVSSVSDLMSNISNLGQVLSALYGKIRTEAPNAAVYVVGYPDLIPQSPTPAEENNGCDGLAGSSLLFLAGAESALNIQIESAALAAGFNYVDPNSGPYSFATHTLCSTTSNWFNGIEAHVAYSFHPNAYGQGDKGTGGLSRSVEAAITADHSPSPGPALRDVKSVTGDGDGGYCALLTSGGVDCWGYGGDGELGNGQFYDSGNDGSATPVTVLDPAGTGPLTGVASVTGDGYGGYCALLTSGGVDCWGYGYYGALGNGQFYDSGNDGSATPVAVLDPAGTGPLTGVASVTGDGIGYGYCALLTSGGVDCWGYGGDGELGNGQFYDSGNDGSATPVAVLDPAGTGPLTGVASVTSDGIFGGGGGGYCALLTSGGVDCWGYGYYGALGNGQFYDSGNGGSATPVAVHDPAGTGPLTGVASVTSDDGYGYCALLTSGGVDCWGYGYYGALGNGQFYDSGNGGSATPVAVHDPAGTGPLTGVASVTGNTGGYGGGGYCALLTSGGVDCWGYGYDGELGNGQFYDSGNGGSATPVAVLDPAGTGPLTGVASVTSDVTGDSDGGYCALLTSGGVDCWGYGGDGELGNGQFYDSGNDGSATPVAVLDPAGTGPLTGVASVTSNFPEVAAALPPIGSRRFVVNSVVVHSH
jgi:hypothetical protein